MVLDPLCFDLNLPAYKHESKVATTRALLLATMPSYALTSQMSDREGRHQLSLVICIRLMATVLFSTTLRGLRCRPSLAIFSIRASMQSS